MGMIPAVYSCSGGSREACGLHHHLAACCVPAAICLHGWASFTWNMGSGVQRRVHPQRCWVFPASSAPWGRPAGGCLLKGFTGPGLSASSQAAGLLVTFGFAMAGLFFVVLRVIWYQISALFSPWSVAKSRECLLPPSAAQRGLGEGVCRPHQPASAAGGQCP